MTAEHLGAMGNLLRDHLVPVLDLLGAAVVDGGTEAGVMRLMGQARAAAGATFPLIGVAAAGTVAVSEADSSVSDTAAVDSNHTHMFLVPGDSWGDEAPWLSEVAARISGRHPSATLVVNGGEITYDDLFLSLASGRPVIVVAGAGRTADAVAAAAAGSTGDKRAGRVAASPLTRVVSLDDPGGVATVLQATLSQGPRSLEERGRAPRDLCPRHREQAGS